MYRLFLRNSSRQYYYGQPFEEPNEALTIALELKASIPYIMITNSSDHSVFESENGNIVFPDDESTTNILNNIPSTDLVLRHLSSDLSEIQQAVKNRNLLTPSDPSFKYIEAALIASAIQLNVNLQTIGWKQP